MAFLQKISLAGRVVNLNIKQNKKFISRNILCSAEIQQQQCKALQASYFANLRSKSTKANIDFSKDDAEENKELDKSDQKNNETCIDKKVKKFESLTGNHEHPDLDLSFNSAQEAYRSKRTSEIARALLVFNLCSFDFLIQNQKRVSISF